MAMVTVTNAEKDLGGATQASTVSATAAASPPSLRVVVWSMAAVVAAAVIMSVAYRYWIKPTPIHLIAGYVPYAGVIAAAAALERFLEPLSQVLLPNNANKQNAAMSKAKAQAAGADPTQPAAAVQKMVADAASMQADVDQRRAARAIIFWAIASVCGLAVSGGFGLFLLKSVAIGHVNPYLDLVVTGLTIGAGTKPTHDFITSLQARATKPA